MHLSMLPSKSPEEEELDRRLADLGGLESRLTQEELDMATLQADLQTFEARYLHVVGMRLAQLDELLAQIAEAEDKLRGTNRMAGREAHQARAQALESERSAEAQSGKDWEAQFEPSPDLKALYREAAKRIHPDLADNEDDRALRTALMAEVNAAYRAGDVQKLRQILGGWKNSPESIVGEDVAARLVRTIRKIARARNRLNQLSSELASLKSSALHALLARVREAKATGRDLLREMAEDVERQIAEQQVRLSEIVKQLRNLHQGAPSNG